MDGLTLERRFPELEIREGQEIVDQPAEPLQVGERDLARQRLRPGPGRDRADELLELRVAAHLDQVPATIVRTTRQPEDRFGPPVDQDYLSRHRDDDHTLDHRTQDALDL